MVRPSRCASSAQRGQLFATVGGQPGHGVQRAAAGRHHLDVVGPEFGHLAHFDAQSLGPVRLAAEVPGVAAGDGDGLAAGDDAGAMAVPQLEGAAHVEDGAARPAEIAHRGDAGRQRTDGGERGRGGQHTVGLARRDLEGRAVAGQVEMHVGVDQAGQQRAARHVDLVGSLRHGAFRHRPGEHVAHAAVRDEQDRVGDRCAPVPSMSRSARMIVVLILSPRAGRGA